MLCIAPASWAAASFSVQPLKLSLPVDKLAAALTLGNTGPAAVTVQAELLRWSQVDGNDHYEPADELVVTPPIFNIAPGGTQLVRVGRLKKGTSADAERAYRIRLKEVPPEAGPDFKGLATIMELSLPIFVPPVGSVAREPLRLQATLGADASGQRLVLRAANPRRVHEKITRLTLLQNGKPVAESAQNFYLLAGASRELQWREPGIAAVADLQLQVQTENRRIVTVPLAAE